MTFLALLVAMPVQGRVKKNNKKAIREMPRKMPRVHEPVYLNTFGADHRFGPKVDYSNRNFLNINTSGSRFVHIHSYYTPTYTRNSKSPVTSSDSVLPSTASSTTTTTSSGTTYTSTMTTSTTTSTPSTSSGGSSSGGGGGGY